MYVVIDLNIFELDLSECLISPEQIAQAIGHMPTPDELAKILAPKKKNKKDKMKGIDFGDLFDSRGGFDWDTTKSGSDMKKMFKTGQEIIKSFQKGGKNDKEDDKTQTLEKENNKSKKNDVDELRKSIEEHKRQVLEQRKEQQQQEQQQSERENIKEKINEAKMQVINNSRER